MSTYSITSLESKQMSLINKQYAVSIYKCSTNKVYDHYDTIMKYTDLFTCIYTTYSHYGWNLVIHGCIDGHSRVITYMKCSDINWAKTVLECFRDAVRTYGLSSRVRSDSGGENLGVAEYRGDYGVICIKVPLFFTITCSTIRRVKVF